LDSPLINLLIFYLFIGHSTIETHDEQKGFSNDNIFNFYLGISILLLTIWCTYHIMRKRISSRRFIWLHIILATFVVCIIPTLISTLQNLTPRRYLEIKGKYDLSILFGNTTWAFAIVASVLLASEIFLLLNLKPKMKTMLKKNG
jgi:hypothetical protein